MSWIENIKDEIELIDGSEKELKKFGMTVGGVIILIGLFLFYYEKPSAPYFLGAGFLLLIAAAIVPRSLSSLHKIWMAAAVVLGFFMTRVILSILFYLVLTPVGFFAKLSGKEFLDLKFKDGKESYWNYRKKKEYQKIDTERQF